MMDLLSLANFFFLFPRFDGSSYTLQQLSDPLAIWMEVETPVTAGLLRSDHGRDNEPAKESPVGYRSTNGVAQQRYPGFGLGDLFCNDSQLSWTPTYMGFGYRTSRISPADPVSMWCTPRLVATAMVKGEQLLSIACRGWR